MDAPIFVESRRSPRGRDASPILLAIASENYHIQCNALRMDASLHGMRIRTDVPLSLGTRVEILPNGRSGDCITTHVVWMQELEISSVYVVGLEFNIRMKPAAPQFRRAF